MKFSHTEWGTWVRGRVSLSRSVMSVSFSFLAGQCNSFVCSLIERQQGQLNMEGTQRNKPGAYVHWGEVGRNNGTT